MARAGRDSSERARVRGEGGTLHSFVSVRGLATCQIRLQLAS